MNCPFCNIKQSKKNCILKEGNFARVILSNPRLMPGHLLVIPRRHVSRISELNSKEKKELWDTVVEFQEKILGKLSSGCDIQQHYRPFLKQSKLKIDHLHVHLLPREFDDELYKKGQIFNKKIFRGLTTKEATRILKILK